MKSDMDDVLGRTIVDLVVLAVFLPKMEEELLKTAKSLAAEATDANDD